MMEVQKRQRLDTAERFQKHLEKVLNLLLSYLDNTIDESWSRVIAIENLLRFDGVLPGCKGDF